MFYNENNCPALAALAGPAPVCQTDCPCRPALPCPMSLNRQTSHFSRPETKRYGFQDLDGQTLYSNRPQNV
jgi:hypothetical protein